MVRGCNVIYHLKQFSLSYEHFNPYIQLCISPQNSDLAGNYITKANGYKKISGVSDTKNFDPNVLGCCFLNGSTANLPASYDSTYIALANGLSMCIPYFENGFIGMYVRTYNGQWFPWQKII